MAYFVKNLQFLRIRGKIEKNYSKIHVTQNFMLIPMQKTVIDFSQYILRYSISQNILVEINNVTVTVTGTKEYRNE